MTVTLATFMGILDSSVASVVLPHIAGALAASSEESTWVLTSYLVVSAIVLPMSGWLSNVIGRKHLLYDVRCDLHRQLAFLRTFDQPADAYFLPHSAGCGRWQAAADRTSISESLEGGRKRGRKHPAKPGGGRV